MTSNGGMIHASNAIFDVYDFDSGSCFDFLFDFCWISDIDSRPAWRESQVGFLLPEIEVSFDF
jgi:hypothetical protein